MPALADVSSLVCATATQFDATTLDRDGAVDAAREWMVIAHAANAAYAMAAARVAECGAPPSAGAASPADFLARQAGTTTHKAADAIKSGQGMQAHVAT